jgi:succinyl-CoA synthetase beta subunit
MSLLICVIIVVIRCDVIALGVINAAKNIGLKKPIIIRLKGTNVDAAKKLIAVSSE